jgi:Tfp pilus assembly protein PilO
MARYVKIPVHLFFRGAYHTLAASQLPMLGGVASTPRTIKLASVLCVSAEFSLITLTLKIKSSKIKSQRQ